MAVYLESENENLNDRLVDSTAEQVWIEDKRLWESVTFQHKALLLGVPGQIASP